MRAGALDAHQSQIGINGTAIFTGNSAAAYGGEKVCQTCIVRNVAYLLYDKHVADKHLADKIHSLYELLMQNTDK